MRGGEEIRDTPTGTTPSVGTRQKPNDGGRILPEKIMGANPSQEQEQMGQNMIFLQKKISRQKREGNNVTSDHLLMSSGVLLRTP